MAASAPTSSTTANVSRKVRSRAGYLGAMIASAPTRNAVSVEMTTPHALASSPDGLNSRKITAGRISPAIAATTGTSARERSVSSPMVNWALTSSPTMKKKNAISASLTIALTVSAPWKLPKLNPTCVSQNSE